MNSPTPPPSPATPTDRACAVPLVELLRAVPHDARYTYTETDGVKATHFIPIGRYAHEAAELIASLQSRLAEAERARADLQKLLTAELQRNERMESDLSAVTASSVEHAKTIDGLRAELARANEYADALLDAASKQEADLARARRLAPLCEDHGSGSGTRSGCPYCALIQQHRAFSEIDYACGPANEMEVSDFDVHCDEQLVVEAVRRMSADLARARETISTIMARANLVFQMNNAEARRSLIVIYETGRQFRDSARSAAHSKREKVDELHSAALALYIAGRWSLDTLDCEQQARLWENLRDALKLAPGTATAAGIGASTPSRRSARRARTLAKSRRVCSTTPNTVARAK